jgi:Histone H1-like protein Hc1
MSFLQTTEELVDLLQTILEDVPKMLRGNKTAAQRIRTKTVKIAKVSKIWRKESLEQEKKKAKPKKKEKKKRRV